MADRSPVHILAGSSTTNANFSRNTPGVRQLKSGKQKKQPSSPFSSSPTNGLATSVPISRRCCRKSSGMLLMSFWPFSSQMLQCTTENWWRRRRATSSLLRVASWMVSCTMGGGSITRRSRSPKPQLRAAEGCWRTVMRCSEVGVRGGAGGGAGCEWWWWELLPVGGAAVGDGGGGWWWWWWCGLLLLLLLPPVRRLEYAHGIWVLAAVRVDGCVLGGLRGSCGAGRRPLGIMDGEE
ncbi:hypothetical protein CHGG_03230 [Chaetomium globosum CBS 148.51]|uniref:Uncharacterized protein n=1 Tax=Chaetomium globosum (strain ATCC 6205 / CBS 148.51 / DSM 1962 / NBRC 6347 / NRRL 1970) TaxID=306901 RepID=Q2H974_CHAGB|nr:uncharacterized protein CHGG_03230 [Chaetomium globosum CBS 148.51]EAQ91295.1 hypothetical protein CHGG_03230 [Chaetomium globosum CBS 148.51]